MQQTVSVNPSRSPYWRRRTVITFWALVAPVLILRLVTSVYPIGHTIWLSFTNTHLIDQTHDFIGLDNYRQMPQDPAIQSAIAFTIVNVLASTALQLLLGLLIALCLLLLALLLRRRVQGKTADA